jgi:5-methylthioribose kinase
MREGIVTQTEYPNFSEQVGKFLARTLFYTSDLFLDSAKKKEQIPQFINPVLCKVTEDLVYTFPFGKHDTNRFPAAIQKQVDAIYSDAQLQKNVARCRLDFMTRNDCLVHGDLHTGSIMVNDQDSKVMDPEFGFYGPFGFDAGMLLANIAIGYFAQIAHTESDESKKKYQKFLKNAAELLWKHCTSELRLLLSEKAKPEWQSAIFINDFLASLEQSAIRHMGCEMIRRTIGMAHVLELDEIKDEKILATVSAQILSMAQQLLHDDFCSVEKALSLMELQ